ncbi:MAG: biotin--[acetyl-CoA-carboxylase] ligase [Thermoplasmatota archaeon]|nr:biotin--[acetyl-CoA-carboxylase] ligase [Halobacteriales archaeon]
MTPAWAVERLASCASTMDEAKVRARKGAPHGTVVVAEEQTGGRGTQGRGWHGPKGGLYLSLVLRGIQDPHLLTLALGNAVADALEVAGVEPRLKWVNDVHVGGRKAAGILVEAESTGSRIDFVVAGIGVNVNGHADAFPPGLNATTLEDELACESCVPDLEALVLDKVGRWLAILADGRESEVLEAFRARDALAGAMVRVQSGRETTEGTAEGVDGQGRLLVREGGVQKALSGGTVQIL